MNFIEELDAYTTTFLYSTYSPDYMNSHNDFQLYSSSIKLSRYEYYNGTKCVLPAHEMNDCRPTFGGS